MKIETQDLGKSYFLNDEELEVLHGIHLTIDSGDFVSITGPSGAGKSTLLHVMGTLDQPSTGRVLMDGQDVFANHDKAIADFRNRNIGFVFQFHHLLPEFTALENVMMPALIQRERPAAARQRAARLLDDVGLKDRTGHRPGELSGGEQQRVALARALVNDPSLILADEPTGNLDEGTGEGIHQILVELNRARGVTVVVVTHNPRLAERMPKRLHLTRDGLSRLDIPAAGA